MGRRSEVVRVELLGGFRVTVGPRVVAEGSWRLRKAAALVKLLAPEPTHRLHKEQAMDLLWPRLGPRPAANNLHRTLYSARRVLDPDHVAAPGVGEPSRWTVQERASPAHRRSGAAPRRRGWSTALTVQDAVASHQEEGEGATA